MKRSVRIHTLAEADLIEIWEYSAAQWSTDQADAYLDDLDRGIRSLLDSPEIGVPRDHVREGYRALFVRSHVVYYKITEPTIHVMRVLHGQMDVTKHLS